MCFILWAGKMICQKHGFGKRPSLCLGCLLGDTGGEDLCVCCCATPGYCVKNCCHCSARKPKFMCFTCRIPGSNWEACVLSRVLHHGETLDPICQELTGLTSSQLCTWFEFLAQGQEWEHIEHVRPQRIWLVRYRRRAESRSFVERPAWEKHHWTNLCPATKRYNLSKSGKWSAVDEQAWLARKASLTNDIETALRRPAVFEDVLAPWRKEGTQSAWCKQERSVSVTIDIDGPASEECPLAKRLRLLLEPYSALN